MNERPSSPWGALRPHCPAQGLGKEACSLEPGHISQGLTWRGSAFMERTLGSGGGLLGGGCFAERFHFHLRLKGFVNKISHLLYT